MSAEKWSVLFHSTSGYRRNAVSFTYLLLTIDFASHISLNLFILRIVKKHTKLKIYPATTLKQLTPHKDLIFGRTFTDHMLTIEWSSDSGWADPVIKEYGTLSIEPSASVFHYSFECFEGLKAYKDKSGRTRLFRPDMNMKRFNNSAKRIALPVGLESFKGGTWLSRRI